MLCRMLGPVWLCVVCAACVGDIDDGSLGLDEPGATSGSNRRTPGLGAGRTESTPGGSVGASPTGATPVVPVPAGTRLTYSCTNPEKAGMANGGLRRLTRTQLANTLRDLLGAEVMADGEIQTALNRLGADAVTADIAQFPVAASAEQPGALVAIAARVADAAAVPKKAGELFGACAPSAIDDACAISFITGFGQRAYRRPLGSAEVTSYLSTYKSNGGGLEGLQATLMRFVQSPALVFQVEAGKATVDGRIQLTDHEVASRISYLVANTMPDAELFAAAASGALRDLGKVRAHVERLLGTHPGAQDKLKEFLSYYAELGDIQPPFAPVAAVRSIDTKGLDAEMVKEALDFGVHNVLRKPGATFRDLLTSTDAFPRSARMATILEASGVATGAEPSQSSARHAGLLLRPALLTSNEARTPAMHRGKVIRQKFLCSILPPPPPEVDAAVAKAPSIAGFSNRTWLEMVTAPAQCKGCHQFVNPLAFVLEGYDQVGMTRTTETHYDSAGKPGQTFPIDTKVSALSLEPNGTGGATDGPDLVRALAESPAARACVAKTAFEYFRLRESVGDADGCALRAVEAAATDAGSLRTLFVTNVANEEIFWRKAN